MENADSNEDFRANLAQLRAYKSYCDITLNVKRTIVSVNKSLEEFVFHCSLLKEKINEELFVRFFVFCDGRSDEWSCKTKLTFSMQPPATHSSSSNRPARSCNQKLKDDCRPIHEFMEWTFQKQPNGERGLEGRGFSQFIKLEVEP